MKQRIGLMGGTFNPIHMAHLMIADRTKEAFGLDTVIFMPAKEPPHKKTIPVNHRYKMVELAIADNPDFTISDLELRREGPSYSLDTVEELLAMYGANAEIYFITGTDSIQDLPTWHKPMELLEKCHFVGTIRPEGSEQVEASLKALEPLSRVKIHFLMVPQLAISSSYIRRCLQEGKSVKYILPQVVLDYIEREGLYKGADYDL